MTEAVLRHRKLVVIGWLLLFIAGGALAQHTTNRLTIDFSMPGQPGYEAGKHILTTYGNGGETQPLVASVTVPGGDALSPDVDAAFAAVQKALPAVRVVSHGNTGDP